jgi:transcriptional regulator with XRE-family HTH domain
MTKINIEIGRKIKTKRHEIGYKQESLAIELGISQSALSRIENGSDSLVIEILYLLTQVLKTPIGYFISDLNGDLFTVVYLERIKLLEEMLLKNETLIHHQVKVIKQLEDQIKDLQEKVSRKNKKIEELKETISQKKI